MTEQIALGESSPAQVCAALQLADPTGRTIRDSSKDAIREAMLERARKLRSEITQLFADAEHWNRVNVPAKGQTIDPDPDGQLKAIAANLDKVLGFTEHSNAQHAHLRST